MTYDSKEAACAAFREQFPTEGLGRDDLTLVVEGHVDEDEDGVWVINDPSQYADEDQYDADVAAIAAMDDEDFEAGMAQELAARAQAAEAAEGNINEAEHPMLAGKIQVHNTALPKSGKEGKCPHCGVSTWDGDPDRVTEFGELSPGSQRDTDQQYTCNECAGEWGAVVDKPKTQRRPSGSSNGLKIEQNRETQNGVTRPSIGGKCRAVWDGLDAEGTDTTAKRARELADANGWDRTTTMVQFYKWRKFNGVTGRQQ